MKTFDGYEINTDIDKDDIKSFFGGGRVEGKDISQPLIKKDKPVIKVVEPKDVNV
jgi:hypothetical protein